MEDMARPEGARAGSQTGPDNVAVPPMPAIRSYEQYTGVTHPVREGISPTIGWQFRRESKGGPVFALITRSGFLGAYKVHTSFPLTAPGWVQAWQALAGMSPENAARIEQTLREREAEDLARRQRSGEGPGPAPLNAEIAVMLRRVTLLGGYVASSDMLVGRHYDVRFLGDRLGVYPHRLPNVLVDLAYRDVQVVDIGGPGLVKSGGGFAGGGVGAVGALEGMAVAAVLDAVTTRKTITTVIRVQAASAELFLLHTQQTPEQVRMHLSRPLAAIRAAQAPPTAAASANAASQAEHLTRLAGMLESGLLTREEFDALKAKLLSEL